MTYPAIVPDSNFSLYQPKDQIVREKARDGWVENERRKPKKF